MPVASTCPHADDLQRYLLGQVSEEQAQNLEAHLRRCDACLASLNTLEVEDTLVEVFRRQGRAAEQARTDETVEGLMHRLRTLPLPAVTPPPGGSTVAPPGRDDGGVGGEVPRELYDFLAPPLEPDELGRLGPYRVLKVLGAGGMGVVFQAEDPPLKRLVALKVMKPAMAASESARRRFLREAQLIATLSHDHIVTIHQVGEDRRVPFLAMQFLHGETLADRLKREGPLQPGEVLRIGRETALGLAAAHEKGLIHRDIKPGNVWLEARPGEPGTSATGGRVKLLDFGLARAARDQAQLTQQGAILGTPAYMAPEQAGGAAVDTRCDLFSLGCVLYHMGTGRPPFTGADTLATLLSVAATQPVPPRELNPAVPAALSDLVVRLLAKDPAGRPASAAAVVEAIKVIEAGLIPSETGGGPPGKGAGETLPTEARPRNSALRRRALLIAAGVLLLAVGGLVAQQIVIRITDKQGGVKEIEIGPEDKVEILPQQLPANHPKPALPGPEQVLIRPEPLDLPAGAPLSAAALVTRPAALAGAHSWTLETRGHRGEVLGLAFRGDGRILATAGDDGTVRLWEADTGRLLRALVGHGSAVPAVTWSPDGKMLASASRDGTVRFWDAEMGRPLHTLAGHGRPVLDVAWSPDGKTLATCDPIAPRLWDVESGRLLETLHGHTSQVSAVAWSPDGKTLASAGDDKTVRLWETATGRPLRTLPVDQAAEQWLAFSPDGKTLAGTGVGTLRLWQTDSGRLLLQLPCPTTNNVAWSPDSKTLALGSESFFTMYLWDVQAGKARGRLSLPGTLAMDQLRNVAWSPDGKTVVLGDNRGSIHFWEVDLGQYRQTISGHAAPAKPPDGKYPAGGRLVTLREDQHLVVSADGHYRGTPRVERELVYVVQTDRGQEALTPEEFSKKYGWRNDPERVRLPSP